MQEKELLNDMLTSQKHISNNYSTFLNECSTENLRQDFLTLLKDEHEIGHQIFSEMQSRGWYKTDSAEQQKIDSAKMQYAPTKNQTN